MLCMTGLCPRSSSDGELQVSQAVPRSGEMQWSGKETGSVYTQIPVQPAVLVRENRKGHDSYTGFSLNIKWSEVFWSVPGLFSIVCLMA